MNNENVKHTHNKVLFHWDKWNSKSVGKRIELENSILIEVTQSQKNKRYFFFLPCGAWLQVFGFVNWFNMGTCRSEETAKMLFYPRFLWFVLSYHLYFTPHHTREYQQLCYLYYRLDIAILFCLVSWHSHVVNVLFQWWRDDHVVSWTKIN